MRCCVVIIRNMYIITTRLTTSEWIFIRKGKYAILRENLADKSLGNFDVRQVLRIKTFSAVFKPKNVCIFA